MYKVTKTSLQFSGRWSSHPDEAEEVFSLLLQGHKAQDVEDRWSVVRTVLRKSGLLLVDLHSGREVSTIQKQDLLLLREMVGVDAKQPCDSWGGKNFFEALPEHEEIMGRLLAEGYVIRGQQTIDGYMYRATVLGCLAASLRRTTIRKMCFTKLIHD